MAAVLSLSLVGTPALYAHTTSRTHYHTINGKRVWHKARTTPAVHTDVSGWRGHIARRATVTNRNLVIDFDNGNRRTVEVPEKIPLLKNGKQVSVHSLKSDQRVRVWAYRIPGAEGAWRATRIIAY
jgi:hypothetical protein